MIPFSFFIHFRRSCREDMQLLWKPLGWLPESFYDKWFARYFQHRSYPWSRVQLSRVRQSTQDVGSLEGILMDATTMINMKKEDFVGKMNLYLDKLVEKGVKVAGLGALTAPLTAGGLALAHRKDICLTNGNAFTAVIMAQTVEKIIQEVGLQRPKVAIVGATGSVGSCVTQILARNHNIQNLLLISQTLRKLERLAHTLQSPHLNMEVSTDLMTLTDADIVVVLTASDETLILPKHLKINAIVLDGTQPRNTSAQILTERTDVTLIDGGLVSLPNLSLSLGGIGLRKGEYFACFAETFLLALEGNATLEQADWIAQVASKYADMGFKLAPFSAFGKPVALKKRRIFSGTPILEVVR
jgi:fatty aldehyde-generating acyl-ACP reductase